MANFPTLKTGAVAQYPLGAAQRFSTESVRFLDGSTQSFALYGAALRRWVVRLDLLDETELGKLIAFAEQLGSGTFAFTDPVTGIGASKCVFSGDQLTVKMTREISGQAEIEIEEIP